jgi:hypothetical protein
VEAILTFDLAVLSVEATLTFVDATLSVLSLEATDIVLFVPLVQ